MNQNEKNIALLPSGFHDILPDEAAMESRIVTELLSTFEQYGYQQIKPPLMEFEDSLLSGKGQSLADKTFRVMDPISHRMMGIRSDMTMQIARIASVRLKHKPLPLRLSYAGQVLRVRGEGLYAERQLWQVGAEFIGGDELRADVEVILVAIDGLKKIGVTGISLDFSLPQISQLIMDEAGTSTEVRGKLLELIEKKDISSIKATGDKAAEILSNLIMKGGAAEEFFEKIKKSKLSDECRNHIDALEHIVREIRKTEKNLVITIDPLERHGFEYHTGISFSFFSSNSKEELGRGGRYIVGNSEEKAVGFTLMINALKRTAKKTKPKDKIFIPFGVEFGKTASLREQGYITIHSSWEPSDDKEEARRLGCGFLFDNDKIVPV